MKIEVNAGNQIKLLRNNTFSDKLTFVDENIQNAQRAKAENIYIVYNKEKHTLEFQDDGCGLDDPSSLLHIASSGWDDCGENPFGQGFFSNIAVADYVNVASRNHLISMDIQKMMTGDIDVEVTENYDFVKGFKLELLNLDDFTINEIKERVEGIAQYLYQTVIFNGVECEKKDFMKIPEKYQKFSFKVDTDRYKGWIALKNENRQSLKLFYSGREVCKLNLWNVAGEIHMLDDGLLNLRSPDRKDIVSDSKYYTFKDEILKLLSSYALSLVESDSYSGVSVAVDEYIDKSEALNVMMFEVYNSRKGKELNQLKGLIALDEEVKNKSVSVPKDIVNTGNNIKSDKIDSSAHASLPGYSYGSSSGSSGGSSSHYSGKDRSSSLSRLDKEKVIYYIKKSDKNTLRSSIDYCLDYDIDIIVCNTAFEEGMCKYMKHQGYNIKELKEISSNMQYSVLLNNEEKGLKQIRAERVMKSIFQAIKIKKDVYVGSVQVLRELSGQEVGIDVGMIVVDNVLYINDQIINIKDLSASTGCNWIKSDARFVLQNIDVINQCLLKAKTKDQKDRDYCCLIALAVSGLL